MEAEAKEKFGDKVSLHLTDKIVDGKVMVDQGVIAGCAGGLYENLVEAAAILEGKSTGNGYFSLNVYPASVPVSMAVTRNGVAADLLEAGCIMKTAFCGPCFGAGDVPANNGLSIRHTTRNFPNREGSKPGQGQLSAVALMDARSIAATAANGGVLTSAADIDYEVPNLPYNYDRDIYAKRCYYGFGKADPAAELRLGPNITDWPKFDRLQDNLLIQLAAVIKDPVTTTDELIPSGETSSYRSNPLKLSEFALSRRVPDYVPRSKAIQADAAAMKEGNLSDSLKMAAKALGLDNDVLQHTSYGSVSSPAVPATAAPENRLLPASVYSAAVRTSPTAMPPSVTAPTASTGASFRLQSTSRNRLITRAAISCMSKAFMPPSATASKR